MGSPACEPRSERLPLAPLTAKNISLSTGMTLCDAHNHLHDLRLSPKRDEILSELTHINVVRFVVNGTREDDWAGVADLAASDARVVPSFGLHPWNVAQRTPDWLDRLRDCLAESPRAGIGEIGLDRWVKGHDLALQTEVFLAQLALATAGNRAATIHCIQAWGALWEAISRRPVPQCGFLLHSYGGPLEMVEGFLKRGARFSYSAYFLHPRKGAQRDVFRQIPLDRLLIETDAPDLRPPDEQNRYPLQDEDGAPINHPANITLAYDALGELRGIPVADLAEQVEKNFTQLFGND